MDLDKIYDAIRTVQRIAEKAGDVEAVQTLAPLNKVLAGGFASHDERTRRMTRRPVVGEGYMHPDDRVRQATTDYRNGDYRAYEAHCPDEDPMAAMVNAAMEAAYWISFDREVGRPSRDAERQAPRFAQIAMQRAEIVCAA